VFVAAAVMLGPGIINWLFGLPAFFQAKSPEALIYGVVLIGIGLITFLVGDHRRHYARKRK
jgi:hypothetical protein